MSGFYPHGLFTPRRSERGGGGGWVEPFFFFCAASFHLSIPDKSEKPPSRRITEENRRRTRGRVCVCASVRVTCVSADVHPGETAMPRPRKMEFMATLGGKLIFTQPNSTACLHVPSPSKLPLTDHRFTQRCFSRGSSHFGSPETRETIEGQRAHSVGTGFAKLCIMRP